MNAIICWLILMVGFTVLAHTEDRNCGDVFNLGNHVSSRSASLNNLSVKTNGKVIYVFRNSTNSTIRDITLTNQLMDIYIENCDGVTIGKFNLVGKSGLSIILVGNKNKQIKVNTQIELKPGDGKYFTLLDMEKLPSWIVECLKQEGRDIKEWK